MRQSEYKIQKYLIGHAPSYFRVNLQRPMYCPTINFLNIGARYSFTVSVFPSGEGYNGMNSPKQQLLASGDGCESVRVAIQPGSVRYILFSWNRRSSERDRSFRRWKLFNSGARKRARTDVYISLSLLSGGDLSRLVSYGINYPRAKPHVVARGHSGGICQALHASVQAIRECQCHPICALQQLPYPAASRESQSMHSHARQGRRMTAVCMYVCIYGTPNGEYRVTINDVWHL